MPRRSSGFLGFQSIGCHTCTIEDILGRKFKLRDYGETLQGRLVPQPILKPNANPARKDALG